MEVNETRNCLVTDILLNNQLEMVKPNCLTLGEL